VTKLVLAYFSLSPFRERAGVRGETPVFSRE